MSVVFTFICMDCGRYFTNTQPTTVCPQCANQMGGNQHVGIGGIE